MDRRIAVLTSGGDAPGMNAAIRAVVRKGIYEGASVFGIRSGFNGLVKGHVTEMEPGSVADIIHRGGTVLHTARCEEFKTEAGQAKAMKTLKKHRIDGLVVVGGDGSLKGARALKERGVCVAGIPATIDNDIAFCDSSIGFDTAVNTVLTAVGRIRDTASSHERTFVVEVMGRDTGFIALAAGVAGGAESILIPEVEPDLKDVAERVLRGYRRGKAHSIIMVAEGAGSAFEVKQELMLRTGLESRFMVLGHIQRGGSPSALDCVLATRLGGSAVDALLDGRSGCMFSQHQGSTIEVDLDRVLSSRKEIDMDLYRLSTAMAI